MKKITYLLLGLMSFTAVLSSCKDPNEGTTFAIYDELPIGLALESKPDYSLWVEMLKKADVYNALNIAIQYTCFVADNEAVQAFLDEKGIASIAAMDKDYVTDLMRYHIIARTPIPLVTMTNGRLADTTASGDYLMSKYVDGNNIYINDVSRITTVDTDIPVINGFVHALDKMLDPITTSMWEQIEDDAEYSIFVEAAKLTGFDELLNEKYYYIEDTIAQTSTRARRRITVFSIPDDVFIANGINNIDELVDRFGFGQTNFTEPGNQVYKFVGYHIIGGYNAYDDLTRFNTAIKKKNVSSFASNELIQLEEERGVLYFNRADNGGTLLGENYDFPARNGVRHNIDGLMPLYTPAPTKSIIELTDYLIWPEWSSVTIYRGAGGVSTVSEGIPQGNFPFIRWQTVGDGAGSIQYNFRYNGWIFENGDILVANMGGMGWWEIDLPAIVKGRYSFRFSYHRAPGDRGTYQALIDGQNVGAPVNFRDAANGYSKQWSPSSIINFTESGPHTLRFSQLTNGVMEIDVVELTPVI